MKEPDLFRALFIHWVRPVLAPTVFSLDARPPDTSLISMMMPFAPQFDSVVERVRRLSTELGMRCERADDIWEHDMVIQDVVNLIARSAVVICDCSGRNPNVFYETGIAHSIGKRVILIAQNSDDIPFDLRHLRFLTYLSNGEGLEQLAAGLKERIQTLTRT